MENDRTENDRTLHQRLIDAALEMGPLVRKRKSHYGSYANLEDIMALAKPILLKHELYPYWYDDFVEGKQVLKVVIWGPMGFIGSTQPLPDDDLFSYGKHKTYKARHAIMGLLGLAPEDSEDAIERLNRAGPRLSKENVKEINDLAQKGNFGLGPALAEYNVSNVEDLPASSFERVLKYCRRQSASK